MLQGAKAYITPSWYETKRATGKVVPTWNYAIVQVYGRLRAIEGKWKVSQNRSETDRIGVAEGLERDAGAASGRMAALVRSSRRIAGRGLS